MKYCTFDQCKQPYDSHGFCANHARQYLKYGHPLSKEEVTRRRSAAKLGNHYVLGKTWDMNPIKREQMKGICKNTGRTHFKEGDNIDELNNKWKGDDVGLSGLHTWVARRLGRPKTCINCGLTSDNPNMIQWANKSRQYKRDLAYWLRL
jgi:hypothetical protein